MACMFAARACMGIGPLAKALLVPSLGQVMVTPSGSTYVEASIELPSSPCVNSYHLQETTVATVASRLSLEASLRKLKLCLAAATTIYEASFVFLF